MKHNKWRFDGASSEAWGDCGIAVFRTCGVVSDASSPPLLSAAEQMLGAWDSAGLVADYSQAELKVTGQALLASALSASVNGAGRLSTPTALLVKPDDLTMWRTYAQLMAQNGIVRGVFTCNDAALRWIRRQAEVESLSRSPASAR